MVDLFGVPLQGLTLQGLSAYLQAADSEPLLWEAKGTKLDSHEVRKQCGGFANGEQGGVLILGASNDGQQGWQLDGLEFPDREPHRWVSSCLQEGVRPIPTYDVHAIDASDNRQVALVSVEALSAGPCIVRGTVYERVPGATVPVKDPLRLSELYARGNRARGRAYNGAEISSDSAMRAFARVTNQEEADLEAGRAQPPERGTFAIFGLAAVTLPGDIAIRIFRESLRSAMQAELEALGATDYPLPPRIWTLVEQDRRISISIAQSPYEIDWVLTIAWDGSIAIGARLPPGATPRALVERIVGPAFNAALRLCHALEAEGPTYTRFAVASGDDPRWTTGVVVRRGPHELGPEALDIALLERELSRAVGVDLIEPAV